MEDRSPPSTSVAQLSRQRDALRHSLDSLGAAERLTQRGRIADLDRQLRLLAAPADAAPADRPVA